MDRFRIKSISRGKFAGFFWSFLFVGGWTLLVKWAYPHIDLVNLKMTYLGLNVVIAMRYGLGPSVASSILSFVCFAFFFVPPYFALTLSDTRYWLTLFIMVAVAVLISRLTSQSRKSAEEAMAAELKVEREKLINSLLSSISHDLRTPLTSISGAASTLVERENQISSVDRRHLTEMINEESIRLNRLVEKILQVTKIESGNLQIRKEPHLLEEVIGSALHRLDPLLEGRRIQTDIQVDSLVPLDDLLIEQVLFNLVENAVRYTPAGSPIDLRVIRDSEGVRVEVLDRGPGIFGQDRQRVFDKFYQSGRANSWGWGLGLAVCQGIVKIHQGKIGVQEREGGGSIFYFSLPTAGDKA